jgi:hypothetical protein
MHPTKVAAILALAVAVCAASYLCFVLYQNVILHKAEFEALDSIEHSLKTGENSDVEDNSTMQYLISGGIAVVALITSLAFFGAARDRSPLPEKRNQGKQDV